jgi:membrane peptidoglycan carboxypeptidase
VGLVRQAPGGCHSRPDADEEDRNLQKKAETYKQTLALIMATRRPTLYLAKNHKILEERITAYLPLLVEEGIVSDRLARATRVAELKFRDQVPTRRKTTFVDRKATNSVRAELLDLLDVENFYTLDRYDLKVETSIDSKVQDSSPPSCASWPASTTWRGTASTANTCWARGRIRARSSTASRSTKPRPRATACGSAPTTSTSRSTSTATSSSSWARPPSCGRWPTI